MTNDCVPLRDYLKVCGPYASYASDLFDAVFIVGLEEHLFPSDMSGDDERQIEEERRLLYVAMTRARKYLYLLYATSRFRYGSVDFCSPSRFLRDIDCRYLNLSAGGSMGTVPAPRFGQKAGFEAKPAHRPWEHGKFQKVTESMLKETAPVQELKVGNVIEHERFGLGTVLSVEGMGGDSKAVIKFLNLGEKTLLLKFARYKILK